MTFDLRSWGVAHRITTYKSTGLWKAGQLASISFEDSSFEGVVGCARPDSNVIGVFVEDSYSLDSYLRYIILGDPYAKVIEGDVLIRSDQYEPSVYTTGEPLYCSESGKFTNIPNQGGSIGFVQAPPMMGQRISVLLHV